MEDLQLVDKKENFESILKKENIILLVTTFILGLVFDFLFFKKPFGVSYPLFVILFYSILIFNTRGTINVKFDFGWFLSIPVFMLSLTYLIFSSNVLGALNFLGIPILVVSQTVLITGNNKHEWHSIKFIEDFFYNSVYKTLANLFKPFGIMAKLLKPKTDAKKYDVLKKVSIGLLISAPLLIIIVVLLSSADQIFANFVSKIPNLFDNLSLGEFIAQSIIIAMITLFSFGYIYGLIYKERNKVNSTAKTVAVQYKFFDPVVMITILCTINLIYIVFTLIQFSYLFGGFSFALPHNFTYAEYARRGFFELVFVTLINFTILLASIGFTKAGSKLVNVSIGVLHSLLVFCTLVMLLSAHYRMSMYEEAYGYTYLRILTHAFMVFLFILFVITLYKIWSEKTSLLKPFIVVAVLSYIIINYINIDVIIINENLGRYHKTGQIDTNYLTNLSYDSVQGLVQLVNDKNSDVAKDVKRVLDSKKIELERNKPWQAFNISEYNAKRILSEYTFK